MPSVSLLCSSVILESGRREDELTRIFTDPGPVKGQSGKKKARVSSDEDENEEDEDEDDSDA